MYQGKNHRTFGGALPASIALTVLACAINSAFAADITDLGAVGATDSTVTSTAAATAPSQSPLSARSAQSEVSDDAIRNYTSPVADFAQVIDKTPGIFSFSPNGVGLGDSPIVMRGMSDSNAVISFDGIPWNDTNGVSHHTWVFFPSPFLGGATVDRSPGSAATIGQATFVGSINLLSRKMEPKQRTSVTASDGTWNTTLFGLEHETGQFGKDGASNLLVNVHEMKSDGYQDYNKQTRDAFSAKYQYAVSDNTAVTAFTSYIRLKTNTPKFKGVTRANYDAQNYTAMLSADPTKGNYFGYNFYDINTNFNYVGITSNLGDGWMLDDKVYVYRYWNKQNYDNFAYNADGITLKASTNPSATSGVDKLNSYVTKGNVLRLTQESSIGILRTGLWYDVADSYRYQAKADPRTWVWAGLPNFSETYTTTTVQPYLEYEIKATEKLHITPGIKYASYKQDFNHLADNGGAVGSLNGAPSVSNSVSYSDVLPSLDLHYQLQPNWAAYAQYAVGDQIPDTGVFDVPNAQVASPPKLTKSRTFQFGSVFQSEQYTLDADIYHTKLDNSYTVGTDPVTSLPIYPLVGNKIIQGVEAESNIMLGGGFSLYVNGTYGTAKYDTGLWVAGAPADTESLTLTYAEAGWKTGLENQRIGKRYADDSTKAIHQAFTIDPTLMTNLFVNYTFKNLSHIAKQGKVQFSINNLLNRHDILDVSGAAGSSSASPSTNDVLTTTAARSISTTLTLDF